MFGFICFVVIAYIVVGVILSLLMTQIFDVGVDELVEMGADSEDLKEVEKMRELYTNSKVGYLLINTLVLPFSALLDLYDYLRGKK